MLWLHEIEEKKTVPCGEVTCLGQKQTGDGEAGICRRVARAALTLGLPQAQPASSLIIMCYVQFFVKYDLCGQDNTEVTQGMCKV